jgi:hypothetical protein
MQQHRGRFFVYWTSFRNWEFYADFTGTGCISLRALMAFRPNANGPTSGPVCMPIDLILGAFVAAFILIYLLAVLAQPERY